MISNVLIEKVKKQESLSEEEVSYILPFIKEIVLKNLKEQYGDCDKRCQESSNYLAMLSDRFNYAYYGFDTNSLFMKELYHHFGIIGFNGNNGPLWYLIDLTYKQFENKTYPVYISENEREIISPGEYISKENKSKLIQDGYIKLTTNNLTDYIDSFISSYSTKFEVDRDSVYSKVSKKFDDYGIKICDDNQFSDTTNTNNEAKEI